MAYVSVKRVHIDKQGNFKMNVSVSNDDRPYATYTFYEDSKTIEEKVLRFIENYNDDLVLTEGCTGNVADALGYMIEHSEIEKPLSVDNFDIDKFMEVFNLIQEFKGVKFAIRVKADGCLVYVNVKGKHFTTKLSKDCLRGYWYLQGLKSRLRVPSGADVKIITEQYVDIV